MTFTKKSADLTPIADTVFAVVAIARKDMAENGKENVVDATIGSLYDEEGNLVAYDSVFDHYDAISHRVKAAYASSFSGNPDYREAVYQWVTQGITDKLSHTVIATPGGSGAVALGFQTFLDRGETAILPAVAWGSYALMVHENGMNIVNYDNFEGDHFNMKSLKAAIDQVKNKQDRIVIVINDPCHNPTGYTLSDDEWKELIALLNETGKTNSVILMDDIAYFDYSYRTPEEARSYMRHFDDLSENVMVEICFSCSKTLTSYGLRCGAALVLAKDPKSVREVEIIMEKIARATWSNIANAAMENFVWAANEGKEIFLTEKQKYIDLMKERSDIFLSEAKETGLDVYPYKEGFFVTLRFADNASRDKVHKAFMDAHIYAVQVNLGIRVAVCSLPVAKVKGLAGKMKALMDACSE